LLALRDIKAAIYVLKGSYSSLDYFFSKEKTSINSIILTTSTDRPICDMSEILRDMVTVVSDEYISINSSMQVHLQGYIIYHS